MELHQVRYFLAACETKSFTRAAARCRVSQPALTAGISKLEEELGGRLFDRDHGGARLTGLGDALRPRFQRLAKECDDVAATAQREVQQHQDVLRLGALSSIGPGRLAPLLAAFRRRAPEVWTEVSIDAAAALMEKLQDGDVEAAITNLDGPAPDWAVAVELYDEPYVALLPPDHRLLHESAATGVQLRDLIDEPYVDRTACELRPKVLATLAEEGLALRPVFRAERDEWVPSLVDAGLGYALLPAYSVSAHAPNVRRLAAPALGRKVSLLRNVERPLSPASQLFWDLARAASKS